MNQSPTLNSFPSHTNARLGMYVLALVCISIYTHITPPHPK